MKLPVLTLLLCSSALHAATTVSSSDTGNPYTAFNNTDNFTLDADGGVTFFNSNNQGSGAKFSPTAGGGTNPFTVTAPTYFTFSATVGGTFAEIFFGAAQLDPNSSLGTSSDNTAFSLRYSTSGVELFRTGSVNQTFSPTTTLVVGDVLNFSVIVTPTEGNPGSYIFNYDIDIDVESSGDSYSATGIQANQNGKSATDAAGYTFNAIGTRNNSGDVQANTLGAVTISDMPIAAVPEPSASLLTALSLAGLAFIRRRK